MKLEKVVASNIKHVRQLRGKKQEGLGLDIKVSQTHISAIEQGKSRLSLKRLEQIAKSLGVEPYILLKPDLKKEISNKVLK